MGTDQIDRLLELGLNRFGAGDVDGALLMWEEALAIDPDNSAANSYVDYVRLHYDLITSGEIAVSDDGAPFAIEEVPEYCIDVKPGELVHRDSAPGLSMPIDQGWDIEETRDNSPPAMLDLEPPATTVELEADEPPEGISFEDRTREYPGGAGRPPSEIRRNIVATPPAGLPEISLESAAAEFQHEETPVGFTAQDTNVRKRELGFVQPKAPSPRETRPGIGLADDGGNIRLRPPSAPPAKSPAVAETMPGFGTAARAPDDVHVRAKTPSTAPAPVADTPSSPLAIGTASTIDLEDAPFELGAAGRAEPVTPTATTRDLPEAPRSPAVAHTETAELELRQTHDLNPRLLADVPLISAPTRELGMRPPPIGRAPTGYPDEELPTKQSDVRAIREQAARGNQTSTTERRPPAQLTDSTRHDVVLPFDPIDARSAQILDDVDAEAPAGESKEDAIKRRIATLLERGLVWNEAGELDKAVAAVDLALSEDPNSPLGQKLIARHRDAIMSVFQNFLGDLERQPQLARPLHELANAPISPRAAFLLSRIDGTLTIDEILDVSGMPRLEAYRHLCQLFLRGILR